MRSTHRGLAAGAVALALLTLNVSSRAQDVTKPWGLSLDMGVRFDDNRDATTRDTQSNTDLYLGPRIEYRRNTGTSFMDLFYAPQLVHRTDPRADQNDNEVQQALGLNWDEGLSPRTRVLVREHYSYTDDPSVTFSGGEVRSDATYHLNIASLTVEQDVAKNVVFSVRGDSRIKRYTDKPYSDVGDEDRNGGGAQMAYLTGGGVSLRTFAAYSRSKLNTFEADVDRDWQGYLAAVGAERSFGSGLRAGLSGGVQVADYDDAAVDSETSPFGQIMLVYGVSADTRIDFALTYEVTDANVAPFATQQRTGASLGLKHDLTPRISLACVTSYENGDYSLDTVSPGAAAASGEEDPSEQVWDVTTSATYMFSRNVSLNVSYKYEDWDSDVREPFQRNTVGCSCRVRF